MDACPIGAEVQLTRMLAKEPIDALAVAETICGEVFADMANSFAIMG